MHVGNVGPDLRFPHDLKTDPVTNDPNSNPCKRNTRSSKQWPAVDFKNVRLILRTNNPIKKTLNPALEVTSGLNYGKAGWVTHNIAHYYKLSVLANGSDWKEWKPSVRLYDLNGLQLFLLGCQALSPLPYANEPFSLKLTEKRTYILGLIT